MFERASYQPTGSDDDLAAPVDEDDAELEKLIQQASRKAEARDEADRDPPPPPPRYSTSHWSLTKHHRMHN